MAWMDTGSAQRVTSLVIVFAVGLLASLLYSSTISVAAKIGDTLAVFLKQGLTGELYY